MSHILAVRNVVKTFGTVRAVDGVSFDVRQGTITGLLGRNGAGKTTTIRMITGIFMPDSGSIQWLGASTAAEFRDRIGYLPEERGLYKQMKIVELLLFLAEIKGKRPADVRPAIDGWLERFELTDKRNAKIEELSKGNQQKVQLIGTLLHDPDLIILDEPQSGLDPVNMVLVRNLLRDLKNEGKTILLSTHMMGEAERMADDAQARLDEELRILYVAVRRAQLAVVLVGGTNFNPKPKGAQYYCWRDEVDRARGALGAAADFRAPV